MALEGGDAVQGTGLAGALARARREAYGKQYNVKKDARGLNLEANAIITYLKDNAVVNTDVETSVETVVAVDTGTGLGTGAGDGSGSGTGTIG